MAVLVAHAYLSLETVALIAPEIVLVAVATWIYLAGAFPLLKRGLTWLGFAALALAGVVLAKQAAASGVFHPGFTATHNGPFSIDLFGHLVRWIVLLLGGLLLLLSWRHADEESPEFTGSLLMALAGLMLVATANELVMLFLALELISIPTYILLFLARRNGRAQEAGAKYFFLSILASALLLYGFSFLYGAAGSTNLTALKMAAWGSKLPQHVQWAIRLGSLLAFAGLAFRLTVVPFQFYAPDVYQGTSHPAAGFLATLPKVAAIAALVRILGTVLPNSEMQRILWQLCLGLALVTMTFGNVMALWQDSIRRLMAYSSIAHGGYLLVGLAVGFASQSHPVLTARDNWQFMDGFSAALLYVVVYAVATLGLFAAVTFLGKRKHEVERIEELAGLAKAHPGLAMMLAVSLFSLAGIPPLAGFWGKFSLFGGAISLDTSNADGGANIRTWFVILAIIGVLNAAISAAYYLRLIAVMYFKPQHKRLPAQGTAGAYVCAAFCAALVIALGLFPNRLFDTLRDAGPAARGVSLQPPTPAPTAHVPPDEASAE